MKKLFLITTLMMTALTFGQELRHKDHFGDTDGDGVVTRAEMIAKAEARFDALDRNGDGEVTRQEMKESHHRQMLGHMNSAISAKLAHKADEDKSGDVTRDEWDAMVSNLDTDENGSIQLGMKRKLHPKHKVHKGSHPKALERTHGAMIDLDDNDVTDAVDLGLLFDKMDADNDGILSEKEMGKMRHRIRKEGPHGHYDGMTALFDTDGDGQLEADDLTAWFAKKDTNQNGILDPEEIKEHHLKLRKRIHKRHH